MSVADTQKQTMGFKAETKQLLQLMIHSLYSNKEIFLRELISNASDAADKLRFMALSNPALYENDSDLKVWVDFDKEKRTITIRDNGIGMTKEEVISNLGTIAKSGTKEFLSTLTGDKAKDSQMIGQFGVGFYSAFVVADSIVVRTRKAGVAPEQGVKWSSKGDGEFDLENHYQVARGTEIELHLREGEDELLNAWHLKHLITKYSDHIPLPVVMRKEEAATDANPEDTDTTTESKDEVVNKATALWTLPKQEISDDEYKALYKNITYDYDEPLFWSHNKVEGKLEYTSLLFIPKHAPFDLYHAQKARGLKLYVKRVFIMDESEQFLPNYLRFVKGILDSNDLPLNVSREILQNNKVVESMRNALTKRVLSVLESMATDDQDKYKLFWQNFGQVMKEGPAEDYANKDRIAKLLRFASTNNNTSEQIVSLDEYISRMSEKQENIYYITAETYMAAINSPHLEIFKKKNIEVLILTDKIDEWLTSHMSEYESKKFKSVARGDISSEDIGMNQDESANATNNQEDNDLITRIKELLKDKVKDVRISKRLTDSPSCIIADEHDMTMQMQKIMRAAGQQIPVSKPILELNNKHLLFRNLEVEQDDDRFKEFTYLLLEQAILSAGGTLDNPAEFVKRCNNLLLQTHY